MRRIVRAVPLLAAAALFLFALAGCGGGDNTSSPDTTPIETTETQDTETEAIETEATETEDEPSDLEDIASADNCRELAELGQKVSSLTTGQGGDVERTKEFFDQLAEKAPEEIRDDFAVFADFFDKYAEVLGDLQAGQTPSPEQLQKLQELSTTVDQTRLTEASTNISKWVQDNCQGLG